MNRAITNMSRALLGASTAMLLLASQAALAITEEDDGDKQRTFTTTIVAADEDSPKTIQRVITIGSDDDRIVTFSSERSIQISIVNGEVTVRVNGEGIPEDRIVQKGKRIIILDENGDEIEVIQIGKPDFHNIGLLRSQWFGDDDEDRLLIKGIEPPAVMLGVLLDEPGPALQRHLKLDPGAATIIKGLHRGLPAHRAGLDVYDIIVKIEGADAADPDSIRKALGGKSPGDTIKMIVIHEGEPGKVTVTLIPWDENAMASTELIGEGPEEITVSIEGTHFPPPDLETLRLLEMPELRDLFLDENRRVFQRMPELRRKPHAKDDLDARLSRLNERLAKLEKMLDELLERAEP